MAQEKKEGRMTLDKLAQMVTSGFEKMDKRFEEVDLRFEQVDQQLGQVDIRFEQHDRRLQHIEYRLKDIQNDQDELARMVAEGFDELGSEINGRIDRLEAKVDQHFTESDDRILHAERNSAKAVGIVLDLQETAEKTGVSVEEDSFRISDHERRIVALEAAV